MFGAKQEEAQYEKVLDRLNSFFIDFFQIVLLASAPYFSEKSVLLVRTPPKVYINNTLSAHYVAHTFRTLFVFRTTVLCVHSRTF